jgi:hypothetical protein
VGEGKFRTSKVEQSDELSALLKTIGNSEGHLFFRGWGWRNLIVRASSSFRLIATNTHVILELLRGLGGKLLREREGDQASDRMFSIISFKSAHQIRLSPDLAHLK